MLDKLSRIWKEAGWKAKVAATRRDMGEDKNIGRPSEWMMERLNEQLHMNKLPRVQIKRDEEGNAIVPDTPYGLMAYLARWDSLLTDEEKANLDDLYKQIWPMGIFVQYEFENVKEPENWSDRNGIGA